MLYIKADTNKITDNVKPLVQIVPPPIPAERLPSGEPSPTLTMKMKVIIIVSTNTTIEELASIEPTGFAFTLNSRLHLGHVTLPV
jgi:hypothetical protein